VVADVMRLDASGAAAAVSAMALPLLSPA